MKILYDNKTGKIYYIVKDADYFWFKHSTNLPLYFLEIPEIEDNKTLCNNMIRNFRKVDENNLGKYKIENSKIITNENFVEKENEDLLF